MATAKNRNELRFHWRARLPPSRDRISVIASTAKQSRSSLAIFCAYRRAGLLRCARNDGDATTARREPSFVVLPVTLLTALILLLIWNVAATPAFAVSDGIAQFGPVTVLAAKSILSGYLPLFNYYQFLGHPIAEVGYYPALYPLTPVAYLLSLVLPGAAQHTWSVLCSLQVLFNTACCYLCFRRCFSVSPILSSVGSLSVAFCGLALLQGGEWFYSLTVYGFVPLVWYFMFRCRSERGLSWPLLIGAAFSIFIWGSNVQYAFYAAHFLVLLGVGWIFGGVTERRGAFLRYVAAAAIGVLIAGPYLAVIQHHVGQSIREIGSVAIAKYFWLSLDPWSVLISSAWPVSGLEPHDDLRPLAANYIGFVPVLGIVIVPYALVVMFRYRRSEFPAFIALTVATLAAFLLAIGAKGGLGYVLYHLPAYSWFRHAIKWGTFFQLGAVFLGVLALSSVLEAHRLLRLRRAWIESGLWIVTVGLLGYQVTTFDQRLRLTGDTLPLPEPVIGVDPSARHVAIWHPGGEWNYKGQLTKGLLAFNYLSLFELPGLIGYEPQVLRKNFEAVGGHFFPGFYEGADAVDLVYLQRWGVRFIRLPDQGSSAALEILRSRFPGIRLFDRGIDPSLGVRVVELSDARLLVFGKGTDVSAVSIDPRGVTATLRSRGDQSRVTLNWLAHDGFVTTVDGYPAAWKPDVHGRPTVSFKGPGFHTVQLRYSPRWATAGIRISIISTFVTLALGSLLLVRRSRNQRTSIV